MKGLAIMSSAGGDEVGGVHHLVCACGFDPWDALGSSNSGPDEDSARVALRLHLNEHSRMMAGGPDWLVEKSGDDWYVETITDRGRL